MKKREPQLREKRPGTGRRRSQTDETAKAVALPPGTPEHCLEELRRTSKELLSSMGYLQKLLQKTSAIKDSRIQVDYDLQDLAAELLAFQSQFIGSMIAPDDTQNKRRQHNQLLITKNSMQGYLDSLSAEERNAVERLIGADSQHFDYDQKFIMMFNPYFIVCPFTAGTNLQQQFSKHKAMSIIPNLFSLHPELQSVFKSMPHMLETQAILKRDMLKGDQHSPVNFATLNQRVTAVIPKSCTITDTHAFTACALDFMLMHLSSIERECVWIIRTFQDVLSALITIAIPIMQKNIRNKIDTTALLDQLTNSTEWWKNSLFLSLCQYLIPERELDMELCKKFDATNLQVRLNILSLRIQLATIDISAVCSTYRGSSPILDLGLKFTTVCVRLKECVKQINKILKPIDLTEKSGFFYAYTKVIENMSSLTAADQPLFSRPVSVPVHMNSLDNGLPSTTPVNPLDLIARPQRPKETLLRKSLVKSMSGRLSGTQEPDSQPNPMPKSSSAQELQPDDSSSEEAFTLK